MAQISKVRYELAVLLQPYDEPDIIYTTDSYLDCMERLKWYQSNYPRDRYTWRKVIG